MPIGSTGISGILAIGGTEHIFVISNNRVYNVYWDSQWKAVELLVLDKGFSGITVSAFFGNFNGQTYILYGHHLHAPQDASYYLYHFDFVGGENRFSLVYRADGRVPHFERSKLCWATLPSLSPSVSLSPQEQPSSHPSLAPSSSYPNRYPTTSPVTTHPSNKPTTSPTALPVTPNPSKNPTTLPVTRNPSKNPTRNPMPVTQNPSKNPTKNPVFSASKEPSGKPSTKVSQWDYMWSFL